MQRTIRTVAGTRSSSKERTAVRLFAPIAAACVVLAGCADKLDGPKPKLQPSGSNMLAVEPSVVCNEQLTTEVALHGKGFSPLAIDVPNDPRIELPTVTLARSVDLKGKAAADVEVIYGGDPKEGGNAALLAWDNQQQMRLTINQSVSIDGKAGPLPLGVYDVRVRNPNRNTDEVLGALVVAPPPSIESVEPTVLCRGAASMIVIQGEGFLEINGEKPSVSLAGMEVDAQGLTGCDEIAIKGTSVKTCTGIMLDVDTATLPAGDIEVTVQNPASASCTDTASGVLRISDAQAPIVFFVDPPVTYNGMSVEATIFTSGLSANAASVELIHEDGTTRAPISDFASPERPNKILAQVPSDLKPGSWDVVVTSDAGCGGTLEDGLTVTSTLDDALLTSIAPSFVSSTQDTAVTISGAGFLPVPRVYLTSANSGGTARALRAVEVKSANSLTAVVPAGITPGIYDVILVNPDSKVDVLEDGLTVTADEPPTILAVTPASLPANASNQPVTITGTGFKAGLSVELDCLTTTGARTTVSTVAGAPAAAGTDVVVNVTMATAAPTGVDAGSICLLRLTNADGAFFEFSAFSVTNSSLNLSPWKSGTAMTRARRAPAAAAGRPTVTSRYLYAIGGDIGVANDSRAIGATVHDTVEAASVDVFGAMGAWQEQRSKLPAARTWAGAARIGRFVYLVGGHDGVSATSTLYRAQILDPLAGPELSDLDAVLSDGTTGLEGGLYYYRVAVVYPANDLHNPGGESLPGELLPVQLPVRDEKILLTLFWDNVAGAHGYRLYRSKMADAAANELELVGEVSCGAGDTLCDCNTTPEQCQLSDDGGPTTAGITPVPEGSLGVWHAVDGARCSSGDCLLGTKREAHAVTAVEDPTVAGKWFLYAVGGRDDAGTYLDTYELATVAVAADGSQTVADFVAGSDTLDSPRAELGTWVMRRENASVISNDDVWLFAGGGRVSDGAFAQTLEAGLLATDGTLGTFTATDPLKGNLAGFGTGASNGQLYTFGGISGSADGTSASLCAGGGSCAPLPDLQAGAFNALGAATTTRIYMGATQESAFFFVVGGHDGNGALSTAQQTVQ